MDEVAEAGSGWAGRFPPPPPRPALLPGAAPDGLTTCDLCTWARAAELPQEPPPDGIAGWVLALLLVSLVSAALGAVIMVSVLRCRRLMKTNSDDSGRGGASIAGIAASGEDNAGAVTEHARRKVCGTVPAENHYTHMEAGRDAPYAWLGRQPCGSAHSSAYYSELSAGEAAYEAVGLATTPQALLPSMAPTLTSEYV